MSHPSHPPAPTGRLRGATSSPVRDILALTERPGVVSFAGGLPAPDLFDRTGLQAAFTAVLAEDSGARALQYSTTEGDPLLRRLVARRLTERGLDTAADDLLITSGSQQALTLVSGVLLEPGDRVLVEEPSYLAALQCFALAGAEAIPIPCDDDGLDPDALEALIAQHRPTLLYTVPTFHNPTGRTLSLERRVALAAVAERTGVWIVEDDPYGELRYSGEALPAVASLPAARGRTLAISTLSKIAAPGLRIGWVRAPRPLLRSLTIAKQAADLHSSTVDQAAAARWLATTDLTAHIERLRTEYGARRDALLSGLAAALPAGSTHNHPDGGMFVWARLPDGWDAGALLQRALDHDVAYVPGAPFFSGAPDRATLRLSFTAHRPGEIALGLQRLAQALATSPATAAV
ncbi:MAG TPA: PLP-dependent aminotransferase family protein [Solirubrobacteraceae bacterium]|jgi:2-aminoadipate transaminase